MSNHVISLLVSVIPANSGPGNPLSPGAPHYLEAKIEETIPPVMLSKAKHLEKEEGIPNPRPFAPMFHSERERNDEESLAAATCPVSARNWRFFTTFRMTSEGLFSREFRLLYFL